MFIVRLYAGLQIASIMCQFVRPCRDNHTRRASVLTLVLIVLSTMVALSVGLAYRTRIELRLAQANARRTQVYHLALGGIERAKALITEAELSPQRVATIGRFAGTAGQEGLFGQLEASAANIGLLMYSVRDERGYLNVNASDPAVWENAVGIDAERVACILDWTDTDDGVRAGGAEGDYYSRLEPPYGAKNQPCATLRELLFVREVTHASYVGEDANRNLQLDEAEADGSIKRPPDNADASLDLGLLDMFTVYGDGQLNVNTVGQEILSALPGLDAQAAQALHAYRAGPDGGLGTDDDIVLTAKEKLADVEALTELQIELLGQYCCFESTTFRVFSYAELSDGSVCGLMATAELADGGPTILYVERLL